MTTLPTRPEVCNVEPSARTGACMRVPDTLGRMSDDTGSRAQQRLTKQGEEALGKLAQDLLDNPLVNGAISRVFEARERAVQAQEVAMGALNIPSAADLERLTRRVRSVSQRLEGIEDGVDRVDDRLAKLSASSDLEQRLTHIEAQLDKIVGELAAIHKALPGAAKTVSRNQERLKVQSED